jgi:pyruvate dehydrogenase E2 component (dihydrolipoamide acetyltransferase)
MARLGLRPESVRGSGPGGRIVEADVAAPAAPTPALTAPSLMRRAIAEKTAASFATIPHFYLRAQLDASELVRLRQALVQPSDNGAEPRLTLTDFLLRALALALRDFPAANTVWREGGLLRYPETDVGLVVGLPDGLLIPVIRAAGRLTLRELARERTRLAEAARQGRVNPAAMEGAATSLSNLGTSRADEFAAVIAPHQSSMLAVGRAAPRPWPVQGRLEVRTTLCLCLSVDHRALDGAPAAGFLGRIVELLEEPAQLV